MAQMAFGSAVQKSTGCTSLGVSGTLFEYAWQGMTVLYCMDSTVKDQVLSISVKDVQGNGKTATVAMDFSSWDAALPAKSDFAIPASCGCAM